MTLGHFFGSKLFIQGTRDRLTRVRVSQEHLTPTCEVSKSGDAYNTLYI